MTVQAFSKRLAFVSGAASGIGRAIAEEFGRRGLQVVVADIDLEGAERVAAGINTAGISRASAVKLDVRNEESWIKALDVAESRHGSLSVLVSNAGVAGSSIPLSETPFKAWEWSRSVNLDGAFLGLTHGARRIIATGEPGHIIATSSMSIFAPPPGMGIYVAMKCGVLALCEALRQELAQYSISVSALLPGPVQTSLLEANVDRAPSGVQIDQREDLIQMLQQGKDPAAVGRQVADALGTNQFWLFTHPELEHRIDTRNAEMKMALHGV